MKKILLFFAFLLFINESYCQILSDSTSKGNLSKKYYWQKSKNQNGGAWVLAVGGVLIFTATGLNASQNLDFDNPHKSSLRVPIGLSIACVAGSIPLFIAARRNKLKAKEATVYFKIETIPVLQQIAIIFYSYPSIAIKLNLY